MIAPFGFSAPARILFGRGEAEAAPALINSFGSSVLLANELAALGIARINEVRGWIASALDVAPDPAFDTLTAFSAQNGLPNLPDMVPAAAARQTVAEAARTSSSMRGNPVPLSLDQLTKVLNQVG